MFLVAYEVRAPGTAGLRPPVVTPDVAQWLCGYLGGDFLLYAEASDYAVAIRPTSHESQAYEFTDALRLHPSSFEC